MKRSITYVGGSLLLGLMSGSALAANAPVTASHSATLPLGANGTVLIEKSWGEIDVEAWDKPSVQVTMSLRTQKAIEPDEQAEARERLDRFGFDARKTGADSVTISGRSPDASLLRPFGGKSGVQVHYAVKMPRTANLRVDHQVGEVRVTGISGNVDAANGTGEVTLRLPLTPQVAVESSSRVGDGEFDDALLKRGSYRRNMVVGHSFSYAPATAHRHVSARVGVGSVSIRQDQPTGS